MLKLVNMYFKVGGLALINTRQWCLGTCGATWNLLQVLFRSEVCVSLLGPIME